MSRFEAHDWYDSAEYYDIIFDADTPAETDFLEAVAERHATSRGRRVLEPACGSGRLIAEMARRGWTVTGFDRSEGMLAYARKRTARLRRRVRLDLNRMEQFRYPGRFDLAHCLVSTFKYLPDDDTARSHLQCIARVLAPGGVYVLGFHLTRYAHQRRQRERWTGDRGGTHVVCNIQSWPPDRRSRTERVRSRLIVTRAGEERRYETEWAFRTYDARQARALIGSVPGLEHVATYDFTHDIDAPIAFDGEQDDVVLVLRRD